MPAAARDVPCPVAPRSRTSTDFRPASSRAIDSPIDTYLPLNDWDCFKQLFQKHERALNAETLAELIRRKSVYYFRAIAQKTVLFDNAATAVKAAATKHRLAIASGARREEIVHILKQGDLENCFSAIVAAEDVHFGKPHPEPFSRAHEKLKEEDPSLKLTECVAIEDSIGGIQSAHGAGMRCLAVAHSYGPERLSVAEPEWVIDSIADFISWMEKES
jgi:beta-phosphoglucomutase